MPLCRQNWFRFCHPPTDTDTVRLTVAVQLRNAFADKPTQPDVAERNNLHAGIVGRCPRVAQVPDIHEYCSELRELAADERPLLIGLLAGENKLEDRALTIVMEPIGAYCIDDLMNHLAS